MGFSTAYTDYVNALAKEHVLGSMHQILGAEHVKNSSHRTELLFSQACVVYW